jgi:hypothetical protein
VTIEEDVLRGRSQGIEGAAHGFVRGAEDVEGIDRAGIEAGDLPGQFRVCS